MNLELLVLNTEETIRITVQKWSGSPFRLTPRIARRAAVVSKLTPCWVTDGYRIYRVTRGSIVPKQLENLRYRVARSILNWRLSNTRQPDYLISL